MNIYNALSNLNIKNTAAFIRILYLAGILNDKAKIWESVNVLAKFSNTNDVELVYNCIIGTLNKYHFFDDGCNLDDGVLNDFGLDLFSDKDKNDESIFEYEDIQRFFVYWAQFLMAKDQKWIEDNEFRKAFLNHCIDLNIFEKHTMNKIEENQITEFWVMPSDSYNDLNDAINFLNLDLRDHARSDVNLYRSADNIPSTREINVRLLATRREFEISNDESDSIVGLLEDQDIDYNKEEPFVMRDGKRYLNVPGKLFTDEDVMALIFKEDNANIDFNILDERGYQDNYIDVAVKATIDSAVSALNAKIEKLSKNDADAVASIALNVVVCAKQPFANEHKQVVEAALQYEILKRGYDRSDINLNVQLSSRGVNESQVHVIYVDSVDSSKKIMQLCKILALSIYHKFMFSPINDRYCDELTDSPRYKFSLRDTFANYANCSNAKFLSYDIRSRLKDVLRSVNKTGERYLLPLIGTIIGLSAYQGLSQTILSNFVLYSACFVCFVAVDLLVAFGPQGLKDACSLLYDHGVKSFVNMVANADFDKNIPNDFGVVV